MVLEPPVTQMKLVVRSLSSLSGTITVSWCHQVLLTGEYGLKSSSVSQVWLVRLRTNAVAPGILNCWCGPVYP